MKKIIIILICLVTLKANAQQGILSPADFEKKIQAVQPQLLDVRTAGEYKSSHLKDALQADWLDKSQFAERTQYLDKSKPVFVYCASGGRSGEAAKWLTEKGFTNVQNLQGGLSSWKMEGRPVVAVESRAQLKIDMYKESIASSRVVLVDFGAEWCPPCKKMEPVLDALQKENPSRFNLIKVDGGIDIDVMKAIQVTAIPTFIIYKNGKETWRKQGIVADDELRSRLLD